MPASAAAAGAAAAANGQTSIAEEPAVPVVTKQGNFIADIYFDAEGIDYQRVAISGEDASGVKKSKNFYFYFFFVHKFLITSINFKFN